MARVNCRHLGGKEDCPLACLLLYGEQFAQEEQ